MTQKEIIPRVLQVFTIMNRGGAEAMIMNYYRHIDRNKIQFDFLVHREEKGVFEDEIEGLGGKIYRMPAINPFCTCKYNRHLHDFFNTHKEYKIIHSHLNTFSLFPLKIAKQHNITCRIAHAHTAQNSVDFKNFFASSIKLQEEAKNVVKAYFRKRNLKYPTHFFSCGKKAGNWLFINQKFAVVNNAIITKDFLFNKAKQDEYKSKFNMQGKLVLGHTGRFNEEKNHLFLLEIFKFVLERKSNCKMVFVGDGKLKKNIMQKAKQLNIYNDILFTGIRSDVPQLLQMMDVFIFPSLYEGLPVTLIEAQASGLKVFASDTITREVALTDDIEFLSIKETPDYWAEKILASIPYKRKNNYDIIKEKGYDIEENARRLQDFYLQQLNNESGKLPIGTI